MRSAAERVIACEASDTAREEHEPTLIEQCQQLANGIGALGVAVNFGGVLNLSDLKPAIDASAAGSVLITKGICTREEWDETVYSLLREVLADVLQKVEEQQARAKKPQIVVPSQSQQPTRAEVNALRALRDGSAGSMDHRRSMRAVR